jgi:lauroyl/myristoyl acyltransferase
MPDAKRLLRRARNELENVRRLVPPSRVPAIAERRVDKLWQYDWYREAQERSMRHLLSETERAVEIPELARAHAVYALTRNYLRWHPRAITHQEVRDVDWLTTKRDPDRGVLLSFTHHAMFTGLFTSLARHGVEMKAVFAPIGTSGDDPIIFRQHRKVVLQKMVAIDSTAGSDVIADHLRSGEIVCLAPDVPGQTEVTFLGKRVRGSSGSARLAMTTNSPVVLVTAHQKQGWEPYIQVHEPIEPSDFADPGALLDEVLRRHGDAVLAWPEAFEMPLSRFAAIEG